MDEIKRVSDTGSDVAASDAPAERTADAAMMEEMAKAGILFGRKRMRTNPKMKSYIFATRNGADIFDLTRTIEQIEKAGEFLKEVAKTGRTILFVGTEPAAVEATTKIADAFNSPRVVERWLGGTLTNFDTLSKRLNYYIQLKNDKAAGRLDKYTKKERTVIEKQIERLTRLFGGLEQLSGFPGAVVVASADANAIAVAEANKMKIPVVAIANSSANPDTINYVIPANDNNRLSVAWIFAKLEEAIRAGVKERPVSSVTKPGLSPKK